MSLVNAVNLITSRSQTEFGNEVHEESPRPRSASSDGTRPAWSERRGILSFAGVVIKRFDQPAENQRAILRAFERAGWPEWIADPLQHDHDKDGRQRLADAVYKLNRHQEKRLIRFRRDGLGTGILWELVKKKK